jgi:glutamine synthetase adenylyltransferase
MKEAYLALRQRIHELSLDEGGRVVAEHEFTELRAWVVAVWDEVFAGVDADVALSGPGAADAAPPP